MKELGCEVYPFLLSFTTNPELTGTLPFQLTAGSRRTSRRRKKSGATPIGSTPSSTGT